MSSLYYHCFYFSTEVLKPITEILLFDKILLLILEYWCIKYQTLYMQFD